MAKTISVRGAREHNLKGVDVDLPRDRLIVVTGLSGSGKSSLAFDTIYAEGQRRYVESLSAYARQFLELMQKPDVESIDGLSPAISIEQKTTSRNPRSTVGTVTEIHDYLRLLFARIGVPYSPATGLPIESQTVSQMVDRILAMPEGTRLYLLAPVIRGRKGEYRKELAELLKRGFTRVKIDGETYDIDAAPALDKKRKHDIEVVVDRVVVSPTLATRLADSVETGLGLTDGLVIAEDADSGERTTFSAKFACPVSGFTIEEIEPRLFSFNNPFGACPSCDGLGIRLYFDAELVVPDQRLSLAQGAVAPWAGSSSPYYRQTLECIAEHYGARMTAPWSDLPAKVRQTIVHGSGKERITFTYDDGIRQYSTTKPFEGVVPNLDRRWRESDSAWLRDELGKFQSTAACESCSGHRLKPEALCVKVGDLHIGDVTQFSIADAARWFGALDDSLTPKQREIARRILKEINERLQFLVDVGLEYLTLSRTAGTLSGGESQRIRLASQIGSGLTGVLYVLDEPSIGLHQRDNARLLGTLRNLRDLGNTVLVVEHDEDAIRSADYVVDMGPGAGVHGGEIVAEGEPAAIVASRESLTGQYLSGEEAIPVPESTRPGKEGAAGHGAGCAREQPRVHRRRLPPRHLHVRHRGLRQRQVHADRRYALPRRRAAHVRGAGPARRPRRHRRARVPRQGGGHRPVAHRPHAALQPGHLHRRLRPDPGMVRRAPGGQGARLQAGALLLQRQGRALRGLPGRRPDQDRDALPAGHLRPVRGVQGPTLQPRDPGDPLSQPVHRGRAGDDRGRCHRLLQGGAGDPQQAGDPAARRPRLHPGGPAGDHALRRGGAAGQARQGAVATRHRAHPLHPGRAHDRAPLPRRAQAAGGAARAGGERQHRGGDRAQPGGDQDRRLDRRSRPGGRRRRRAGGRRRHARRGRRRGGELHRAVPAPRARPRAGPPAGASRSRTPPRARRKVA